MPPSPPARAAAAALRAGKQFLRCPDFRLGPGGYSSALVWNPCEDLISPWLGLPVMSLTPSPLAPLLPLRPVAPAESRSFFCSAPTHAGSPFVSKLVGWPESLSGLQLPPLHLQSQIPIFRPDRGPMGARQGTPKGQTHPARGHLLRTHGEDLASDTGSASTAWAFLWQGNGKCRWAGHARRCYFCCSARSCMALAASCRDARVRL